ncbi:hypothetical protein BLA39750_03728 [Burkholderia lata]|uniref:Uncharacterized protein n=1 Tax=Burkholderia lata (strain ATCC 17760 / DSM 23089 / LMG 22485 / NCIMB 9086 / R18194 / 383) TaxID=482957 RepID=A0A6P2YFP8_BURL3|nr:hypothetical protein BLA39750_03728 [Burkholderia lata]
MLTRATVQERQWRSKNIAQRLAYPPTIRVLDVRGLSIQLDSLATSTNWMQFSEVLR